MANSQESAFTFEWKIKNLSYSWLKKGEPLENYMQFEVYLLVMSHSCWSLLLYPKGTSDNDHVCVYLRREFGGLGPETIDVRFEFAFLDMNGSILSGKADSKFKFIRGSKSGISNFVTQDKIFGAEREKFLPGDILIVQCSVWIKYDLPLKMKQHSIPAQTVFEIYRRSFLWSINRFSNLNPGQANRFVIKNKSGTVLMIFHLISGFDGEIKLEIISWHKDLKSFSFQTSVIDSDESKVNFGSLKVFTCDCKERTIPLLTRKQLMQNKSRYLPNDVLTLACEYVFSTGTILHTCEENNFGIISPSATKKVVEEVEKPLLSDQNELQQTQALVDDLKSMYNDAVLCDIELRTSTQTFPAHMLILSARSPVFRRMFDSDMKEKNSGHVDITDLEDDTVHRMLLYVYTDSFGDLQFESASKLYTAADKYAIFSLKKICSCFLKDNMSPTNACDLLTLADERQDDDLKRAVQDYIIVHDKEVFGSSQWKDFMATNLQLAADIMYRKVVPASD